MKSIIYLFLLTSLICSCGQRAEVDFIKGSRFYKDYDIFKRTGINEIDSAELEVPFIQEYSRTDSVITLRVYDSYLDAFETVEIPAIDGIELREEYNYNDAPDWIYGTISNGKVIRYGYYADPYSQELTKRKEIFLYDIIPDQIQIITEDTIKTVLYQSYLEDKYGIDCNDHGDWSKMKDRVILPFKAAVNVNWGFRVLKDNVHIEVITDSADYYNRTIYVSDSYGSKDKEKFGSTYHRLSRDAYFRPFKKYRDYLNPTKGM
jgi:hypothetical protein